MAQEALRLPRLSPAATGEPASPALAVRNSSQPVRSETVRYLTDELKIPEKQAVDLDNLLGLNNANAQIPTRPQSSTHTRRDVFGFIGGGLLLAGTTLVGYSLFDNSSAGNSTVTDQEDLGSSSLQLTPEAQPIMVPIDSSGDNSEISIRPEVQGSHAYVNYDVVSLIAKKQGYGVRLEVLGSDATQYYEEPFSSTATMSGVDIVTKDGVKFIRFPIRPTGSEQQLRHIVQFYAHTPESEGEIALPQELSQYQADGGIELFFEDGFDESDTIDNFLRFFNKFGGLFPDYPPILTVRHETKDSVMETYPPENASEIRPEIPVQTLDIFSIGENIVRLPYIQTLSRLFIERVETLDAGVTPRPELAAFRQAIREAKLHLLDQEFGTQMPPGWPVNRYFARHHLFHPKSYIPEVEYDTSSADNEDDILSALLLFSQNGELASEFEVRLKSLHELEYDDEYLFTLRPALNAKLILKAGIQLIRESSPRRFAADYPVLAKMYENLELDAVESPTVITSTTNIVMPPDP